MPKFEAPTVIVGDDVWWRPGNDRSLQPFPAKVVVVTPPHRLTLFIMEPNRCYHMPGVPHVDDPSREQRGFEVAQRVGCWDMNPTVVLNRRTSAAVVDMKLHLEGAPQEVDSKTLHAYQQMDEKELLAEAERLGVRDKIDGRWGQERIARALAKLVDTMGKGAA